MIDQTNNENGTTNGKSTPNGQPLKCSHEECTLFSEQAWLVLQDSLKLSAREVQITRYIFADRKEKAIAEELSLSPHTVRTYCERLYRKLNVNSRVEMVVSVVDRFLHLTDDPRQLLPPVCGNHRVGRCPLYNN